MGIGHRDAGGRRQAIRAPPLTMQEFDIILGKSEDGQLPAALRVLRPSPAGGEAAAVEHRWGTPPLLSLS